MPFGGVGGSLETTCLNGKGDSPRLLGLPRTSKNRQDLQLLGILALGVVTQGVALFYANVEAPAFQFDEAWWALFDHRFFAEPRLHGMSGYTLSFIHGLTALGLKLFGPHVAVYRAVGKLAVLVGTGALSLALWRRGERRTAALLPWAHAALPGLVMNERWVVELNTFGALALGLSAWALTHALSQKKPGRGAVAALAFAAALSVSVHVLLVVPWLALAGVLVISGASVPRAQRGLVWAAASAVVAVLGLMALQDERRAELAAIGGAVTAAAWLVLNPRKWAARLGRLACALGYALAVHAAVFWEGSWQAKQYVGFLDQPLWIGAGALVALPLLWLRPWQGIRAFGLGAQWVALTLLLTYLLVPKVGARYLEVPMLALSVGLAASLARLPTRTAAALGSIALAVSAGQLWSNYLKPSLEERQVAVTWRLGRLYKESSEDFLPKIKRVRELGALGCKLEDLTESEPGPELRFMALGDWPIAPGPCRITKGPTP